MNTTGFLFTNWDVVPHPKYVSCPFAPLERLIFLDDKKSVRCYKCHINIKIVTTIYGPNYLYKYVHKGGDKAALTTVPHDTTSAEQPEPAVQHQNEIKNF